MTLLRVLSQLNLITEKIYFDNVDNIKKDLHDLGGYFLYLLSAQKKMMKNNFLKIYLICYLVMCGL